MDGEFPEQFKCPICFEIPEKEIYQCQNGHTLCDVCVQSLSLCPQCRVSLGTSKIRSRPLEELLDMMKFNCSYKQDGCKAKVTRREITTHFENCSFGGARVPLCKYIGYTCSHEVNTKKLQESLHHFQQEHQCLYTNEDSLNIKLKNFNTVDKTLRCLWKPIIVSAFSNLYLLVICTVESNIYFTCIVMGENPNEKVQIKFRMVATTDNVPVLEWITKPIPQSESEALFKSPPYQFSLKLISEKYLVKGDLTIQVSMSDYNFKIAKQDKMFLAVDSFVVLEPPNSNQPTKSSMQQVEFSFAELVHSIQARFRETFHSQANCNVCRVPSLNGLRFKCLQCANYDLCIGCMEKKEHSFHHFVIICTDMQERSVRSTIVMNGEWVPFVDFPQPNSDWSLCGSALTDAKELCCRKCKKPPDYICLQCVGPLGLCGSCFVNAMYNHNVRHFFAVTTTNAAREFALFVLRKQSVLPPLRHEVSRYC